MSWSPHSTEGGPYGPSALRGVGGCGGETSGGPGPPPAAGRICDRHAAFIVFF